MAVHKDLGETELHEAKGIAPLVAGAADIGKVVVSKGDGTSEARKLVASEVGALVAGNNFVVINTKTDFPTPSAGTITLLADTAYIIADTVALGTDRIIMGTNTAVTGIGKLTGRLTYTGSGAMFTSTESITIENLFLDAGASGTYFAHSDTVSKVVNLFHLILLPSAGIGTFTSTDKSLFCMDAVVTAGIISGPGITFAGTWGLLQVNEGAIVVDGANSCIDLGTAVFESVNIVALALTAVSASSVCISGLASSGNLSVNSLGKITNALISVPGGGTILSGLANTDIRWRYLNSSRIQDTRPDSLIHVNGNVTETTIVTQSVAVKATATWTSDRLSQFSFDATGKVTFTGEVDTTMPIDISVSADTPSGSHACKFFIALNGTEIANSAVFLELTSTTIRSGHVIWQHTFTTGDFIELFVSNEASTTNITVDSAIIRVN